MLKRILFLVAAVAVGASAHASGIKVGDAAPDFTLNGADGKSYKLSQFKGKPVVLEWFNHDCPYVRKHYDSKNMQSLQKKATQGGTVWLAIVSSSPGKEGHVEAAEAQKLMQTEGMAVTALLLDPKGEVGKMYQAKTTPHMFVVDAKGTLVYQGAIDDRPSAAARTLQGATNYVDQALAALAKNQPVKTASTTPYGCSVKY